MNLHKARDIKEGIEIDTGRMGRDEHVTGIQCAEDNNYFLSSAFPLMFRVRAKELEQQASARK